MFLEKLHTELIIKEEYDLNSDKSVEYSTDSTDSVPVPACTAVKEGMERVDMSIVESTVHIAVTECTSVKKETIEDNMDTEDPLSVLGT